MTCFFYDVFQTCYFVVHESEVVTDLLPGSIPIFGIVGRGMCFSGSTVDAG